MPEIVAYSFPAFPWVRAFTTLRPGRGTSTGVDGFNLALNMGDDSSAAKSNRKLLRRMLPSRVRWLEQVHGNEVLVEDGAAPARKSPPKADGLLTRERNVVCAVLTADCMPLLLASPRGAVAAVHVGWRGLAAGIIENALAAMGDTRGVSAQIGPHIRRDSYQVGDDAKERLVTCAEDEEAFTPDDEAGKYRCDLSRLAARRLRAAGVESVAVCGLDTFMCGRLLYSARRDGVRTGRMATVIWRA